MVKEEKLRGAIHVIQDLAIRARNLAHEGAATQLLAEFLDAIEYFPALMLEEKDRTDLFEMHLEETCAKFDCREILTRYLMRTKSK